MYTDEIKIIKTACGAGLDPNIQQAIGKIGEFLPRNDLTLSCESPQHWEAFQTPKLHFKGSFSTGG